MSDGLHICIVCGDCYTYSSGMICHDCRRRQMIDNGPGPFIEENLLEDEAFLCEHEWVTAPIFEDGVLISDECYQCRLCGAIDC